MKLRLAICAELPGFSRIDNSAAQGYWNPCIAALLKTLVGSKNTFDFTVGPTTMTDFRRYASPLCDVVQ